MCIRKNVIYEKSTASSEKADHDCIHENVILQNQVISMGRVKKLNGIGLNDTSNRQHLKIRIEKEFPEKLYFFDSEVPHT